MTEEEIQALAKQSIHLVKITVTFLVIMFLVMGYYMVDPTFFSFEKEAIAEVQVPVEADPDRIENGIHVRTGFIDAEGMQIVIANCTNCHSAKLVTQNRMTAERWNETIKWMQETQNLWDLGENQAVIVNYLVTNYPPDESSGRRANLTNIEWYELED